MTDTQIGHNIERNWNHLERINRLEDDKKAVSDDIYAEAKATDSIRKPLRVVDAQAGGGCAKGCTDCKPKLTPTWRRWEWINGASTHDQTGISAVGKHRGKLSRRAASFVQLWTIVDDAGRTRAASANAREPVSTHTTTTRELH